MVSELPAAGPDMGDPARLTMTASQRAAYADPLGASEIGPPGDVGAADQLNMRELMRLDKAAAAYAVYQTIRPNVGVAGG